MVFVEKGSIKIDDQAAWKADGFVQHLVNVVDDSFSVLKLPCNKSRKKNGYQIPKTYPNLCIKLLVDKLILSSCCHLLRNAVRMKTDLKKNWIFELHIEMSWDESLKKLHSKL